MRTLTNKHLTSSLSRNPEKSSLILGTLDEIELSEHQLIAQVIGTRGQSLLECLVQPPASFTGSRLELKSELFELQTKLRNLIWIKKGHYVVVERWPDRNIKLSGEIIGMLYPNQISHLKKTGQWPLVFTENENSPTTMVNNISTENEFSDTASDEDDLLFENPNIRRQVEHSGSDSSQDSDE